MSKWSLNELKYIVQKTYTDIRICYVSLLISNIFLFCVFSLYSSIHRVLLSYNFSKRDLFLFLFHLISFFLTFCRRWSILFQTLSFSTLSSSLYFRTIKYKVRGSQFCTFCCHLILPAALHQQREMWNRQEIRKWNMYLKIWPAVSNLYTDLE